MQQEVKQSYNKIAHAYNEQRDLFKNQRFLEKLAAELKPNSLILDLGCGAGKPIDSYLVDQGFRLVGVDISESQIELAKMNVPEAEYRVADMSELAAGEFKVDAIVSFYAIFHTPREGHLEILKKMHSWLNDDGLILITMGASEWEGEEDFHGAPMWWSHFGAEKNQELVKEAGFEIIKSEIDDNGSEKHLVIIGRKQNA